MSKAPVPYIGPRLSVMMFLQFFVWGAWYVTVGNYMTDKGMAESIDDAYTVGPLAAIIAPFFLGLVADRFFSTERVLAVMHLLGGGIMFLAPSLDGSQATLFVWGVLFAHMLCYMPTLGLTNTLAFHNLTNQERQFPLIRVFGTIGWIVAGLFVSWLLQADTKPLQFYVTGAAAIVLGVYSFTLPHTPPPAKGKNVAIGEILGAGALRLFSRPSFAIFMGSSFLICIPLSFYYAYAPVYAGAVGFEDPGAVMQVGQAAEVVFMFLMPFFFVRLGVKWMLFVGMLAWVARYALFALAAPDSVRWMVIAGIALHGICYDFFFVTGQIYVDKIAPKEIRGQAQGLLVLVTLGLGMAIGAQAAGYVVARNTPEGATAPEWGATWWTPCAFALVCMILFAIFFRNDTARPGVVSEPEPDAADGEGEPMRA